MKTKIIITIITLMTLFNFYFFLKTKEIYSEASNLNYRFTNIERYLVGDWEPAMGVHVRKMAKFTERTQVEKDFECQ